jgi:hypothetical protein
MPFPLQTTYKGVRVDHETILLRRSVIFYHQAVSCSIFQIETTDLFYNFGQ